MVRALVILVGFSAMGADLRFTLQPSKPKIYQGESFATYFVLESSQDLSLEVEVAKFPGFRGFWSENVALRQGPMILMKSPFAAGLPMMPGLTLPPRNPESRIGIVGTYIIASMQGHPAPAIDPMRVEIRRDGKAETMECEMPPINLLPLPPIPPSEKDVPFVGAVGQFRLHAEKMEIPYVKGEPFSLRLLLEGEGNFAEVNEIPLRLPEGFELVSQTSTTQVTSPTGSKIFDFVLSGKSDSTLLWNPGSFLFFDPRAGKYFKWILGDVKLVPLPPPVIPLPSPSFDLVDWPVSEVPTTSIPLLKNPIFWASLLAWHLLLVAFAFKHFWTKRQQARKASPRYRRYLRFQAAQSAKDSGDWMRFLRLAFVAIQEPGEAFPETEKARQTIRQAHEESHYSPTHRSSVPQDEVERAWMALRMPRK